MNEPARRFHPYGRTREEDLRILADGGFTGWWDDTGQPAPWPEDFLDPDAGWTTTGATPQPNNDEDDPSKPPF